MSKRDVKAPGRTIRPGMVPILLGLTAILAGCMPEGLCPRANPYPPPHVAAGERIMAVSIPARSAQATLKKVATTAGVATWISNDRITLSLRDGILVGTRGLGHDLMVADTAPLARALAAGGGSYERVQRFLSSDNQPVFETLSCRLSPGTGANRGTGATGLRPFAENCRKNNAEISNIYWLDRAGTIQYSTQWAGDGIGYMDINYQTH